MPYIFFFTICQKQKLSRTIFYSFWHSYKFFNNFHLSKSSFTCTGLQASGLAWRLTIHSSLSDILCTPITQSMCAIIRHVYYFRPKGTIKTIIIISLHLYYCNRLINDHYMYLYTGIIHVYFYYCCLVYSANLNNTNRWDPKLMAVIFHVGLLWI